MLLSCMRYLVKAKLKSSKKRPLIRAINNGSLGRGSVAGDEYLHNMREARVDKSGTAIWAEQSRGPAATAIARRTWRKNSELKERHFSTRCGRRTISRSPLQLRLRRTIRRNSSFIIRASSLVGSCFIASRSTSKRLGTNTSTHHDTSICFLITRANAI